MKLFHSSKKAALSLLAGTAVVLAFVAGAAAQRVDDYRGGGMPSLEILKKNFLHLRGVNNLELVDIVGKAPLENGGWQVYYYAKDRQGGVFVDDKMTLTKLDSDIWIMHVRTAGPETTQWGIVTQY